MIYEGQVFADGSWYRGSWYRKRTGRKLDGGVHLKKIIILSMYHC